MRQQHVKRNTTKYENGRRLQQATETVPIKEQDESHIKTEIAEGGLVDEGGGWWDIV